MRRTGSGFEAITAWVTRPGTGTPYCHSERCGVNPPHRREEDEPYLRRSPLASGFGLPSLQNAGIRAEKSAEAIVATVAVRSSRRAEFSIVGSRLQDANTGSADNSATAEPRLGGEAEPTCWVRGGPCRFRHLTDPCPWRLLPLHQSEKPPYTIKYVRWCGRTGAVRLPPTRFSAVFSILLTYGFPKNLS